MALSVQEIQALIVDVPDFPKPGIVFKDITPLVAHPRGLASTVDHLAERVAPLEPDSILAIESRGFIFGAALAERLGLPMHLVRKQGKLPRESISVRYELEYGYDHLEVHTDAIEKGRRCLIVDDVIATGGTAAAVAKLVRQREGVVAGFAFVIELGFLEGRRLLGDDPIVSLISY